MVDYHLTSRVFQHPALSTSIKKKKRERARNLRGSPTLPTPVTAHSTVKWKEMRKMLAKAKGVPVMEAAMGTCPVSPASEKPIPGGF